MYMLFASLQEIRIEAFGYIFHSDFDEEEIRVLHKFIGHKKNYQDLTYVMQTVTKENISNHLKNKNAEFPILSSIIADKLPMLVTEMFKIVPSEGDNSSQLFNLVKLGFESFEVELEQLDGQRMNLVIQPIDTVK